MRVFAVILTWCLVLSAPALYAADATVTYLGAHSAAWWDVTGTHLFTDTIDPADNDCPHITTIRPTGERIQCLTCTHPALWWSATEGQPDQSPNGRWLLFTARTGAVWFIPCSLLGPGQGKDHELWVMDLHSPAPHVVHKLRDIVPGNGGTLLPKFSHSGTRIAWTDYEGEGSSMFGNWRLAVANFVTTPTPRLTNIQYYDPVPDKNSFMEMQGWGPGDNWLYFACEGVTGQLAWGLDLCRMDLPSGTLTRLTHSSGRNGELQEYEEHAHLSADGQTMAYITSHPVAHPATTEGWESLASINMWQTDLWRSRADGTQPQQVTYFNQPGHAHYTLVQPFVGEGKTVAIVVSWHPSGQRIALSAQFFGQTGAHHMRDQLFMVELP